MKMKNERITRIFSQAKANSAPAAAPVADALLLTSEAAERLRIHPEYCRFLIRNRQLGALKRGKTWLVPASEVVRYLGALSTAASKN